MSTDYEQRYEAAKQAYAEGHYTRCCNLLADMIVVMKGTDKAQESLYMMAMAQYNLGDYETAATYFKQFYTSYPKGEFSELARYNAGKALYNSTPDARLDQSATAEAISELQTFLDFGGGQILGGWFIVHDFQKGIGTVKIDAVNGAVQAHMFGNIHLIKML